MKHNIIFLFVFIFSGCELRYLSDEDLENEKQRKAHVANSAATIWEAAEALRRTPPVSPSGAPLLVIQANANAIIKSQGYVYAPADAIAKPAKPEANTP